MFSCLFRSVRVEFLKLKRSQVLWVALCIPLFPAALNFGQTLKYGLRSFGDGLSLAPWSIYFQEAVRVWTMFALPFVVAILSAMLANRDHKTHQWKLLFALPFPRSAVFTGKWVVLMALNGLSSLVFMVMNVLSGLLVMCVRPELGLALPIPWAEVLLRPLLAWLLSTLMITIQLWISLHWTSFLTSILSGFLAFILNIYVLGSFMYKYAAFVPWSLPSLAYEVNVPGILRISLVISLVVYLLAQAEFVRRDVL